MVLSFRSSFFLPLWRLRSNDAYLPTDCRTGPIDVLYHFEGWPLILYIYCLHCTLNIQELPPLSHIQNYTPTSTPLHLLSAATHTEPDTEVASALLSSSREGGGGYSLVIIHMNLSVHQLHGVYPFVGVHLCHGVCPPVGVHLWNGVCLLRAVYFMLQIIQEFAHKPRYLNGKNYCFLY